MAASHNPFAGLYDPHVPSACHARLIHFELNVLTVLNEKYKFIPNFCYCFKSRYSPQNYVTKGPQSVFSKTVMLCCNYKVYDKKK